MCLPSVATSIIHLRPDIWLQWSMNLTLILERLLFMERRKRPNASTFASLCVCVCVCAGENVWEAGNYHHCSQISRHCSHRWNTHCSQNLRHHKCMFSRPTTGGLRHHIYAVSRPTDYTRGGPMHQTQTQARLGLPGWEYFSNYTVHST